MTPVLPRAFLLSRVYPFSLNVGPNKFGPTVIPFNQAKRRISVPGCGVLQPKRTPQPRRSQGDTESLLGKPDTLGRRYG